MQSRTESAHYLNGLSPDELFSRYGITRIGNITGLDIIGVPVYNAIRPCGRVLSVNSGKGLSKEIARAGAIGEGIEYATFECPRGEFFMRPFDWVDPEILPLARDSQWRPKLPIALEYVTHFASGEKRLFPSDLLWMVHRRQKRMDFQMTSNAQAVGYCFGDAFLRGLYEGIERDAVTLRLYTWEQTGVLPPRVHVEPSVAKLGSLLGLIAQAGLKLFVFYCTVDIPLPVYWAMLVDPSLGGFFTTAGWGCHIDSLQAAQNAILEAIQSRCVYIAGARDDLLTSDYDAHKAHDPIEQMALLDGVAATHTLARGPGRLSLEEELSLVLRRLAKWRDLIYYNCVDISPLVAVKTVILGLEPPRNAVWVPSKRAITWVQACTDAARNRLKENSGDPQQNLATFCATFCATDPSRSV